ncbi:hypothetical protein F220043C3_16050 [Enterocloster asparagiformis]
MTFHKPNKYTLPVSLAETILKLILSNIKGTPENLLKEIGKHIKY